MVPIIKQRFNYLAMEVQPLDQDEYAELKTLGLDAVMVYQETYHPKTYAQHHLRGNKMDFRYRLETPDRLAKAGIDKIGIGALIGLEEWRATAFLLLRTWITLSVLIGNHVIRFLFLVYALVPVMCQRRDYNRNLS